MNIPIYDPGNPRAFINALSADQLKELGQTIMKIWEEGGGKMIELSRCPICEGPLKNWHTYKPTWSQVRCCFQIIELLKQGHKHVHIKTTSGLVPIEHRDHTVTGLIMSHYSKMMYLNMMARCDEDGKVLGHFVPPNERQDEGMGQFTITREGYDFVHGKAPLCPGLVRIKYEKIIDVPENRNIKTDVRDLLQGKSKQVDYQGRQDEWMDSKGKHTILFPEQFLPPVQGIMFGDDDE